MSRKEEPPVDGADGPADPSAKPKLLSSTMVMASGTLVSRILGMVRVIMAGWILGLATRQADMFSVAGQIPSQVYLLIAGGVLNSILLPQLVRAMRRDEDGGQSYSDRIVTLFLLLLIGLTVLLLVGTPVVLRLTVSDFWLAPDLAAHYRSLTLLAALCMPQVFFFGIFFLGGQLLNARGSFGPLMWAPALNNVIQILLLGTYALVWRGNLDTNAPFSTGQALLLGLGSVAGVVCQSVILFPFLRKVGFHYRPRFDFLHTGLGSTAQMAKWALGLVVLDQINYFVISKVLTRATAGGHGAGLTIFNNATLISMVPHSLLTVSLATALMPSLSALSHQEDWSQFIGQFVSSLRVVYAAIIPMAALFLTMGTAITTLVWKPSEGGVYAGITLAVLGVGLVPMSLRFLTNKAFNSMGNTRTPFFIDIIFVLMSAGVSVALVFLCHIGLTWIAPGVALAYLLGYAAAGGVDWRLLKRAVPGMGQVTIAGHTLRLAGLSVPGALLAGAVCWLQGRFLPGVGFQLAGIVVGLVIGIGVYWGLARLAHIREVVDLEAMVRSRLRGRSGRSGGADPTDLA